MAYSRRNLGIARKCGIVETDLGLVRQHANNNAWDAALRWVEIAKQDLALVQASLESHKEHAATTE